MPLVLVAGPSGVGKTAIINELIRRFSCYRRPLAYTTRRRREGESAQEFSYVDEQQLQELYLSGELLTLDDVHGHKYALSRGNVKELIDIGVTPLKEFHIKDHPKVKSKLSDVISVAIIPKSKESYESHILRYPTLSARLTPARMNDLDHHLNLTENGDINILITNDFLTPIEQIAVLIHQSLRSHVD